MLNNKAAAEARATMGPYETLMVNAFVDGLHDVTSDLTRSTRPQTLAVAYQVASEHESAIKRRKLKDTPDEMKNKTPLMQAESNRPPSRLQHHTKRIQHRIFVLHEWFSKSLSMDISQITIQQIQIPNQSLSMDTLQIPIQQI